MNANMPTGRGWRRRRRGPCRRPRCRPRRRRRRSRCRRRRRHAVAAPCVKWRRPQRRDARNDVHARHSPSLFMTATSARTPLSSSKPSHRSTPPPRPPPHVGGEKVPVAQVRRHAPARQRWVQHHQLRRLAAPPPPAAAATARTQEPFRRRAVVQIEDTDARAGGHFGGAPTLDGEEVVEGDKNAPASRADVVWEENLGGGGCRRRRSVGGRGPPTAASPPSAPTSASPVTLPGGKGSSWKAASMTSSPPPLPPPPPQVRPHRPHRRRSRHRDDGDLFKTG